MVEIIVAVITGVLALLGVVITNAQSNKKIEQKIQIGQAVTDCKLEELTREVREHNNFAKRMPIVEEQIKGIREKMDYLHSHEERPGE